jgi:hypothetical protein
VRPDDAPGRPSLRGGRDTADWEPSGGGSAADWDCEIENDSESEGSRNNSGPPSDDTSPDSLRRAAAAAALAAVARPLPAPRTRRAGSGGASGYGLLLQAQGLSRAGSEGSGSCGAGEPPGPPPMPRRLRPSTLFTSVIGQLKRQATTGEGARGQAEQALSSWSVRGQPRRAVGVRGRCLLAGVPGKDGQRCPCMA